MDAESDKHLAETPVRMPPPTLSYKSANLTPTPSVNCAVGLTILGIPPLLLGLGWLHTFVFTDFRAHLRPIGIPLGIVATLTGLALIIGPWHWRSRRRHSK